MVKKEIHQLFELTGKTAIITGGAGLLGRKHAEALMEYGANCVLVDICVEYAEKVATELTNSYKGKAIAIGKSIIYKNGVDEILSESLKHFGSVDILINNAANNPKYSDIKGEKNKNKRFETFSEESWHEDVDVGLKGSFLCSQVFGTYFAEQNKGVILNIASDLGVIAPDQRLYRKEGLEEGEQPTKPVTYSVVKTGLLGLNRYLATYWADKGVRSNALILGGVFAGQDEEFVNRVSNLIPMNRMANVNEYQAAVVFLCSDASLYMTGATLTMDGGRTCW